MAAFVLSFGARGGRRYLAQTDAGDDAGTGRRPLAWVREASRALTFPSAGEARAFGLAELGHAIFDVGRCEAGA